MVKTGKEKKYWVCIDREELKQMSNKLGKEHKYMFLKLTDNGNRKEEDGEIRLIYIDAV